MFTLYYIFPVVPRLRKGCLELGKNSIIMSRATIHELIRLVNQRLFSLFMSYRHFS